MYIGQTSCTLPYSALAPRGKNAPPWMRASVRDDLLLPFDLSFKGGGGGGGEGCGAIISLCMHHTKRMRVSLFIVSSCILHISRQK